MKMFLPEALCSYLFFLSFTYNGFILKTEQSNDLLKLRVLKYFNMPHYSEGQNPTNCCWGLSFEHKKMCWMSFRYTKLFGLAGLCLGFGPSLINVDQNPGCRQLNQSLKLNTAIGLIQNVWLLCVVNIYTPCHALLTPASRFWLSLTSKQPISYTENWPGKSEFGIARRY